MRYCMWLKFFSPFFRLKLVLFYVAFVMKFEWVQEKNESEKRKRNVVGVWQVLVCVEWITKTFLTTSSWSSLFLLSLSVFWGVLQVNYKKFFILCEEIKIKRLTDFFLDIYRCRWNLRCCEIKMIVVQRLA